MSVGDAFSLPVTATDGHGTPAVSSRNLIDDPPVLTITAPVPSAVARPSLLLTVSCADDDPAGCSSLTVAVVDGGTIASGVSSINETVSLASYEGQRRVLRFDAVDSIGQHATIDRFVFVESSTNLVEVASAAGAMLDDSPDRTLFLANDLHPSVLDKSNQQIVQLATSTLRPSYGRVTDHGAISMTKPIFTGPSVVQLHDGVVTDFGVVGYLVVDGNYALVDDGDSPGTLWRVDLAAGTSMEVVDPAAVAMVHVGNDVGPNGDVVWATQAGEIRRYHNGVVTQLTNYFVVDSGSPNTDGVNIAYQQIASGYHAIRLLTNGGDELLSDLSGLGYEAIHPQAYVTNGGWTAFVKPANGAINVWRRAPDGRVSQVSFFGDTSVKIDALKSDGAVTFANASRLWLASPGANNLYEVSQSQQPWTRSFWRDGDLHVIIGASVFKLVPPLAITAQPSNQTAPSGETATLSVTAAGTGPFTYQWYTGLSGDTTSPIGGGTSSSYTTPPVTSSTRYWVRVSGPTSSVNSVDALVSFPFTDDPLSTGVTLVKAVHVNELRARVDAVRVKYGLSPFTYSQPSITAEVTVVVAQPILELRTALAEAYTAAGWTPPFYVGSPAPGLLIRAADIAPLRSALVAIE